MFRLPAQRLAAVLVILLSCFALPLPDAAAQSREPRARTNQDAGRDEEPDPLAFAASGHTFHGDWQAQVVVSRRAWRPLQRIQVDVTLNLAAGHLASLASANVKADKFCVLVTAERTFDATGWLRLPSDERMSTLLTPAGVAIEGGVQGAVTDRYGYPYKSPVDLFASLPVSAAKDGPNGTRQVVFSFDSGLPPGLPPGLYRLRIDAGVMVGSRLYNINGFSFAVRPSTPEAGTVTYFYSPLLTASGQGASGGHVDADRIKPRFPWLLLAGYNSNGYRGVVAEEDRARFATSDRNLIPDEVVLPMYDDNGNRIGYSLEPQFPADSIDQYQNIGWDYGSGQLSVRVAGPDGSLVDLGTASFVAKSGNGATTRNTAFTGWKPQGYGRYTVTATGWIADREGRRYQGGGTYRFWIAKRMTLATATFQGQPYPVGSTYGRDIQFNPAVPADVQVTAKLFVDSDVSNVRMLSYTGKASPAGLYGAAQGMKAFPLDAPGEYHAQVLATYTDADGHLWVSVMRHAGVVYPASSPVIARGKKFSVGGKYVERGETRFEGYVEENGEQHLAHITFPYLAGDMLLIGTEGQGANKIEPVLTYQAQGDTSAWDTKLNGVGTTNLSIKTSNWYSPHLYPEYITDIEYYYGAAPRPGFMGRFLVGESTVRAPYWPVSPNSFGGQIGASPNGDSVGDIYRLLGGVVLRPAGKSPMYAGYMANAFLLPKGTNNNRVAAPGSEDLVGPLGERARFFLVGLRPGTSFELGSTFRPALQIDPMLPAAIEFTLTYPDGRRQTATGVGDASGSFAGPAAWPLDVPGIYRYQVRATWNGFHAGMPGLPEGGGHFFVYSKTRPAGAAGLRIDGASQRTFAASAGTTISGTSSAATVHYTLITPGAVIEQGEIPVKGGRFSYAFSPAAVNAKVPIYDIRSITTGQPQLGRVLHLTFFAEEKSGGGSFFDVARVILRGSTAIAARGAIPVSAPLSAAVPSGAASVPGLSVGIAAGSAATTTRVGLAASGSDPDFLRAWDERVRALERHGGLRVASTEPDTLVGSRVHERLQQYHGGVPIYGADLTRQAANGETVSLFGVLHRVEGLDTTPAIGERAAAAAIERHTGAGIPSDRPLTLTVLPLEGGGYRLAWMAEARTATDVILCFLDAATGRVLRRQSVLKAQAPPGIQGVVVLDARGDAARAASIVSGTASPAEGDRPRQDARGGGDEADTAAHLTIALQFFETRFGRRGLDGRGTPVTALVNAVRPDAWHGAGAGWRPFFAGGFWDGRRVVVGAGLPEGVTVDGLRWAAASRALDLISHELAHGVMDASWRPVYRGEAGALSEAFADMMGTAVEFAADADAADYLVAEDCTGGTGIRSLRQPSLHGLPDHYDRRVATEDDHGGVHTNSTIAGHAYYLAIEGGTNATSGLAVEGVGRGRRDQVERAFYRAFVWMLPSDATFHDAREATIQSARDLYGAGSPAERAIAGAWAAVGVRK